MKSLKALVPAALVAAATQLPVMAQATMPDPSTYVDTIETLAIAAAVVGASIFVWKIGKRVLGKLIGG